jgi:hypothetical protein
LETRELPKCFERPFSLDEEAKLEAKQAALLIVPNPEPEAAHPNKT